MSTQILNIGRNKTQVTKNNTVLYVSYKTPVAAMIDGMPYQTEVFYSVTTSKHIRIWLESFDIAKDSVPTKDQAFFDSMLDDMGVSF